MHILLNYSYLEQTTGLGVLLGGLFFLKAISKFFPEKQFLGLLQFLGEGKESRYLHGRVLTCSHRDS